MHDLRLLPSVAAALPGIHGPAVTSVVSGPAGFWQSPVSVQEQRSHQLRKMQVEIGKDEELVPENMTPVGLAMEAAGGYADIEIDGVAGRRLKQMEDVEVQGQSRLAAVALEFERESIPQVVPFADVVIEEHGEGTPAATPRGCFSQWIADRAVPRCEQGNDLLDGDRLKSLDVDGYFVSDEAGFFDHPAWRTDRTPITDDPGPRHLCDTGSRLTGMSGQGDVLVDGASVHIDEVVLIELAVASYAGIGN